MSNAKYKDATIVRATYEDNFFRMKRQTAQDKNLSFEARGMIAYILSQFDGWEMKVHDLQQNCAKGRVYRILDELAQYGYLEKRKKTRVEGRWVWTPYVLHERPYPEKQDTEKQDTENADIKEVTTKRETTDKEKELSTDKIKSNTTEDINPVVQTDKLSADEYDTFILNLNRHFKLNGGRVHDVYHQLRGTTANKKSRRYLYGALFRDKPVTLNEILRFVIWYKQECEDCSFPISADSLEDWFGKYRVVQEKQANKRPPLSQRKRPANYELLLANGQIADPDYWEGK
jgi:predicted transcriptional regulator